MTTKKTETRELTVQERATAALVIDHTEAELKTLAAKYADVTEIKDRTDYDMVKAGAIHLGKVRVSIEKAGKAARDDANAFAKAVIGEQKRLVGIIASEEERLKALRKDKDDEAVRIARAKQEKEEARKAAIQNKVAAIRAMGEGLLGADSDALRERLERLQSVEITDAEYQEFHDDAQLAKNAILRRLEPALEERIEFERQKAESDRIAAEQAARQAEIDKQAEAIRKQQEAIDAEKRAEEQRKLDAERAESERIKAEKERLEREVREREEAERAKAEAEAEEARKEALRPEKARLRDWVLKLRSIDGITLSDPGLNKIQRGVLDSLNDMAVKAAEQIEAL